MHPTYSISTSLDWEHRLLFERPPEQGPRNETAPHPSLTGIETAGPRAAPEAARLDAASQEAILRIKDTLNRLEHSMDHVLGIGAESVALRKLTERHNPRIARENAVEETLNTNQKTLTAANQRFLKEYESAETMSLEALQRLVASAQHILSLLAEQMAVVKRITDADDGTYTPAFVSRWRAYGRELATCQKGMQKTAEWLSARAVVVSTNRFAYTLTRQYAATKEAVAWGERMGDVADDAWDDRESTAAFMSGTLKDALEELPSFGFGDGSVTIQFRHLEGAEFGYWFAFDVTRDNRTERWYLSELEDSEQSHIILWKKQTNGAGLDRRISICFAIGALFEKTSRKGGKLTLAPSYNWRRRLPQLINEAVDTDRSEKEDEAGMRNFDLPKDRPIVYLGLAPENHREDSAMRSVVALHSHFPGFMNSQGYHFIHPLSDSNMIEVTRSPAKIIEDNVAHFAHLGITDFYLNIKTHGNNRGFHFKTVGGRTFILSYDEIMTIFRKYPHCHLVLNTTACHGAGIQRSAPKLEDVPGAEPGRITILTQTKQDAVNMSGNDGSVYNAFFCQAIAQGKTYGAAHRTADILTQQVMGLNAEAYRSMPAGSPKAFLRTAKAGGVQPVVPPEDAAPSSVV